MVLLLVLLFVLALWGSALIGLAIATGVIYIVTPTFEEPWRPIE